MITFVKDRMIENNEYFNENNSPIFILFFDYFLNSKPKTYYWYHNSVELFSGIKIGRKKC